MIGVGLQLLTNCEVIVWVIQTRFAGHYGSFKGGVHAS